MTKSKLKLNASSHVTKVGAKRICNKLSQLFGSISLYIPKLGHQNLWNFDLLWDSIYLDPPRITEILNQITSVKNKAVAHMNILPFFLKAARHVIAPYLSWFLNFAFTKGIFPGNCKIARITPIYKSGAKEEMNNYRPISILTCFSKIKEKILFVRFGNFFKKHNVIYYENHDGFQTTFPHHVLCWTVSPHPTITLMTVPVRD